MSKKINLFISTKNNIDLIDDKSKLNLTIPDSLISVKPEEHFIMRLMSFYCYNTLYNVNSTNNLLIVNYVKYYLNIGNPNVLDIRDDLNNQFLSLGLVITYDRILNKYIFSNNSGTSIRLDIQTCGLFLGLDDNTTYNILGNSFITSVNPLSVIGNNAINISMTGDIELEENNLDTIRYGSIQTNNIIFQKLIDSKSNCLISYENNGDNLYEYRLNNVDSINYLTIHILDENLNYLKDLPDWNMTLQFEKVDKNSVVDVLLKMSEYIYDILQLIFSALQHYKIM